MERSVGIEPTASAWKAEVLPLYEPRIVLLYNLFDKKSSLVSASYLMKTH
ncbi:uncharacterized protein METZ01_LOCUS225594 [marine metagenome]|uniref:Uncharacterized protein n=1 Tax=marine metagenome TaxID=408172 RepID=A0A382GC07_9ZZZZ